MSVKCPLCTGVNFTSAETLLLNLVSFTTTNLACPLCPDVLRGFDKLTVHLYTHVFEYESDHAPVYTNPELNVLNINDMLENICLNGPLLPVRENSNIERVFEDDDAACGVHLHEQLAGPDLVAKASTAAGAEQITTPSSEPSILHFSSKLQCHEGLGDVKENCVRRTDEENLNFYLEPNLSDPVYDANDEKARLQRNSVFETTRQRLTSKNCELSSSVLDYPINCSFFVDSDALTVRNSPPKPTASDDFLIDFDSRYQIDGDGQSFDAGRTDSKSKMDENCDSVCLNDLTGGSVGIEFDDHSCPTGGNGMDEHCGVEKHFENVSCDFCSLPFPNDNILALHKTLVHENMPERRNADPKYGCTFCKRKFKLKASLFVHQRAAHSVDEHGSTASADPNKERLQQFRCSMCSKTFKKVSFHNEQTLLLSENHQKR